MTACDLQQLGLIDDIVPEPPEGAQADPDRAAELLKAVLRKGLAELAGMPAQQLIEDRYKKFRHMGNFFAQGAGAA
jgi:acetyl-CoA carboxylase alpha subunit